MYPMFLLSTQFLQLIPSINPQIMTPQGSLVISQFSLSNHFPHIPLLLQKLATDCWLHLELIKQEHGDEE